MAQVKKELKRMSRRELIEIIDAMQLDRDNPELPSAREIEEEREHLKYRGRYVRVLRSTICALVVTAAVAVLLAMLLFPVLQVSGDSMEPTFANKDIILLMKTSHYKTGDLCSFNWQNKMLIKRIIGGPGDIIEISDSGEVSVNGTRLDEPYVDELALGNCDLTFPYQVPENRYFVLGDHRSVSVDSRNQAIGCVEKEQMAGKVFLRVWPFQKISVIH